MRWGRQSRNIFLNERWCACRYELFIIGEHEFRVEHSLLALPGVKKEDIKRVMSHPQALAQCDNYLRNMG